LLRPRVVRRLVLAGTGPRGGHQMHGWTFDIERVTSQQNNGIEDLLHISFEVTETRGALGGEYVQRAFSRDEGRDRPNGAEVARASTTRSSSGGSPTPRSSTGSPGSPSPRSWQRA
jgi:hypothetical protein